MSLLFLLFSFAWADKFSYPPQKIKAEGVERIQISGVRGSVRLSSSRGAYRLKVRHSKSRRFDDWSLAVDRQNSTLYLEISSATYGAQWRKSLKREDWPEFDIELSGPSKPVTISWREGDLHFNQWKAGVESSHIDGPLEIIGGGGSFRADLAKGNVTVKNYNGDLNLKGETGAVSLINLKGQAVVNWIQGPITVNGARGGGRLVSSDSELKMQNCKGEWNVQLAKGNAFIDRFEGKITAEGQSANWALRPNSRMESEVKSLSGAVAVRWPLGGLKVFLTSNKGEIGGRSIVQSRLDGEGRKVAELQIGKAPYGQLFVRTETGPIVLK